MIAQEKGNPVALNKAKNMYEYGKFDAMFALLNKNMSEFSPKEIEQVYKLKCLTNLAMDNKERAKYNVVQILLNNPSYTPDYFDSQQFSALVFDTKQKQRFLNTMSNTVTSASKIKQSSIEVPNPVFISNIDYANNYNHNSINDILYSSPGFFPSRDFERRTVGSRGNHEGWNNNHLLVLIDGVPFNDNFSGAAYTSEITPLAFTGSVEVIRGPGGALYGSNATNGVVAINTLSSKNFMNRTGYVKTYIGNKKTRGHDIATHIDGKNFSMITAFSYFTTEGDEYAEYDLSLEKDANGDFKKFEIHDNRANSYFFTKIEGKNKFKGLSLQYHHQNWTFETGHGWLDYIPENPENLKENRNILVAKFANSTKKNISYEYVIKYQKHQLSWDLNLLRQGATYPANSPSGVLYPVGMREFLATDAEDIFARAQYRYKFKNKISLLGAIESSTFYYNGDKTHFANFNLEDGTFLPLP